MNAPYARTLFDLLCEQADRRPAAVAVISGAGAATFADLAGRARKVAGALAARGVRRGDRIGLLLTNRTEWLEICLGASGAGAIAVPFSTWSTRSELEFLLADSGITHLFVQAEFGDRDFVADVLGLAPNLAQSATSAAFPSLREVVVVDPRSGDPFVSYEHFLVAGDLAAGPLPQGLCRRAARPEQRTMA